MAEAKDKTVTPKMTELSVNYSVGVKAQIVKFELSADAHVSRSERWNVEGLSIDEINTLYEERYVVLREELGDKIEKEYEDMIKDPA